MKRSNELKENESNIQAIWGKTAFEADAPGPEQGEKEQENKKKFFVTFPFPYANGRAHLGHVFTMLKADIMARHYKTKGYNVLFPFGFHGTGIPIPASANRLRDELDKSNLQDNIKDGVSQYSILSKMGIPEEEIPKFTDPEYWIRYFPKVALDTDLPSLGCAIDYRRSFMTTEINPHFDSFVRWQFDKLNEKGYMKFGYKYVIYSRKNQQPCSDADRSKGEGVEIKEMKVAYFPYLGIFLTYDPTIEPNTIAKSSKLTIRTYLDSNGTKIRMPEVFQENYSNQPTNWIENWSINSHPQVEEEKEIGKYSEINLAHGSGFYSSDPDLNWKVYYEPDSEVISRSGDRCVVAETEQWFILYDQEQWKDSVYKYVSENVKFTDSTIRNLMLSTIERAHPWPVSRTFGLGTKLPFDKRFLIDSLSDSTIYMAYYTIAHLIQNVPVSKLNNSVWDAIFLGKEIDSSYDQVLFNKMRNEYQYWYPMDLRVSGKDLVTNHLTMMFFNHMAILGPESMPKMIYANGHIMVDGVKMSKSKGNFITLEQAVKEYGVDVTRFICATAGDDSNDGNFQQKEVDPTVLAITSETQNWGQMYYDPELKERSLTGLDKYRLGDKTPYDHLQIIRLNKIMKEVDKAYSDLRFRDVIKIGFYELQNVRNNMVNPHVDVLKMFLGAELAVMFPIIPHWVENLSREYQIPYMWPDLKSIGSVEQSKMEWLYTYCQVVQPKITARLKRANPKGTMNYTKCRVMINQNLKKYMDIIQAHTKGDEITKEGRKEIIKCFKDKKEVATVIEIMTHLEKCGGDYGRTEVMGWITENHGGMLKSYLDIYFKTISFEVVYGEFPGDPFNPIVEFA